jgi:hypothetical protein
MKILQIDLQHDKVFYLLLNQCETHLNKGHKNGYHSSNIISYETCKAAKLIEIDTLATLKEAKNDRK